MANNNAECQLFCCPLDPTGQHTIDASYRASMFASPTYSASGFTFLPRDNIIKYPANAGTLETAGINYLRYRNPDFGNRWIYCFIRSIEYAAPDTAILHIERDAWVTWVDRITPKNQAYIERQRVSTAEDAKFQYTLPEPVSIQNYTHIVMTSTAYQFQYIGIICRQFNINSDLADPNYTDPNQTIKDTINNNASNSMYGYYVGGLILVIDPNYLRDIIQMIELLGSEVIAAFMMPTHGGAAINHIDIEDANGNVLKSFGDAARPAIYAYTDPQMYPSGITATGNPWGGGNEPHNKKLYSFPYTFLTGCDHCGGEVVYKIEDFADPANIKFDTGYVAGYSPSIVMNPLNYEGVNDLSKATINNNVPQIPWCSNAYAIYMGQNANALAYTKIKRTTDAAFGGIASPQNILGNSYSIAMSEEAEKAKLQDLRGIADSVSSVPSCNAGQMFGQTCIHIYQKFCSVSDMKRIDNFFSRFGYRVDKVGTISWNKRSDYDYIKTQGANIGGTIPVTDKAKINALLDGGLTVFHRDYGIYPDIW